MKQDLDNLLLDAAANGAVDECLDLIRRGADPRAKDHEDGSSALHWAADGNHREVCRILIEAGADLEGRCDEGQTPLHRAARTKDSVVYHPASDSRSLECPLACRVLLEAGADGDARDKHDRTPLHAAAQDGSAENCRVLAEAGADPNARDDEGDAPLHLAVFFDRRENCRVLVDVGADPNARNLEGETPLHLAAFRGCAENCRVLLEAGADPRARDDSGMEPIYRAFLDGPYGYLDVFRCLVERDPSIVRAEEAGETTPLLYASSAGDPEVVRFLLEAGSDPDARNRLGNSPLHEAAAGRIYGVSAEDRLASCELLLAAGADPAARNDKGRLPEDETDDENIRDRLRSAREAIELGTAARPVEELEPSRRRRLGRKPAEDRTDEA